ncbi:MAG TPA: hypothetical protein VML75_07510 [Kofleriaceae bacterium]|nr:hypothetical protein [Kofleriaceae bacterium]
MKTLAALSLAAGLALSLSFGLAPTGTADAWAGKPCARTKFESPAVKKACTEGGQTAAKKLMKDFVKQAKKVEGGDPELACDSCHTKVGGDFPTNKEASAKFKKLSQLLK